LASLKPIFKETTEFWRKNWSTQINGNESLIFRLE
jgi:hypothetical protein